MEHNMGKYMDALHGAVDPEEIRETFGLRDDGLLMLYYGKRQELFDKIVRDLYESPNIEEGFESSYYHLGSETGRKPKETFKHESGVLVTVGGFRYPLQEDELVVFDGKSRGHIIYTKLSAPKGKEPKGDLLTLAFKDVTLDFCQYVMGNHIMTRIPTAGEGIWRGGVNHIPKYPFSLKTKSL